MNQLATSQIEKSRALVRAFQRLDKAEAAYRAAQVEMDRAFQPWAAKRSISRDEAREHLTSTGLLAKRTTGA